MGGISDSIVGLIVCTRHLLGGNLAHMLMQYLHRRGVVPLGMLSKWSAPIFEQINKALTTQSRLPEDG